MGSDNSESNSQPEQKKNLITIFKKSFRKREEPPFDPSAYKKLDMHRQNMVRGIFKLSELNARDIMIPRVDIVAVESDADLKSVVKKVHDAGHSRVPIFEETIDNIIGILYVKDLLKRLLETSRKKFNLKKILHEPFYVPETMPLDELLLEFKIRKLHLAIVVDEYGGVGGIVTLEDILEEIVGEIRDEFDIDELPEIEKTGKNVYEVDSRMPISEFNEKLNLNIAENGFDTIGGYVFDLFGKIPMKNETVKSGNLTFKIKDINGTVINRIVVTISRSK